MPRLTDQPKWIIDQRAELGHRLAAWRRAARLSQAALARVADVDLRTLQRDELGATDIPYSRLLKIALALGMTVGELVSKTPAGRKSSGLPDSGPPPTG